MSRARYVKSEGEIDAMRRSVAAGERVVRAIYQALEPGRPQVEVFAQAMLSVIDQGAMPVVAWCPGQWAEPRPRLVGPPPGSLDPGLYISTEIVVPVRGAPAQVAQTFVVGPPNAEAARAFDISAQAFEAALGAMKPGATWGEVERSAQHVAKETGFWVELILHGMGSGPLLTPHDSHDPVHDDPLVEGTTFILKPFACPDGVPWIARSHDVSWGDTVVVRSGGAERLGTRPIALLSAE
jgi:Xaa-Pro aminopeptidase